MKIDSGFVVGTRWRFVTEDDKFSNWSYRRASGSTGLIMIYKNEKTAGRHNTFGLLASVSHGYFDKTQGNIRNYDPSVPGNPIWRKENVIVETKLFPIETRII